MQTEPITLVTVIMPVYNAHKYLKKALDSIISQSLKDIEIILIDDGSTDGSGEICDSYAKIDNRIKVVHQTNGGISRARNRGLDMAAGRYVAFADNDDLCMDGWLEDNYNCIERYDADVVKFGRITLTVENDQYIIAEDTRRLEFGIYDRAKLQTEYFHLRNSGVFSPIWDGLYRRDLIEKYNLRFDEYLKYGEEDTVFCLKLLPYIEKLITNNGVYYKHYIRKGFSTSSKFDVESLNKYVYSSRIEAGILNDLKPVSKNEIRELSNIKNYLLPILLQLNHENCNWNRKAKVRYLKTLYKERPFLLALSFRQFMNIFKKDKNKAVIGMLFQRRLLSVLLLCSGAYYRLIEWRQRQNRIAFKGIP